MGKKIWCAKVCVNGSLKNVSEIYIGEGGKAVKKYKRRTDFIVDGEEQAEIEYTDNISRTQEDGTLCLGLGGAYNEFAGGYRIILPQYYKEISVEVRTTGNATLGFMGGPEGHDETTTSATDYEVHKFAFEGVQKRQLSCNFGGASDPGAIYIKNLYGLRG